MYWINIVRFIFIALAIVGAILIYSQYVDSQDMEKDLYAMVGWALLGGFGSGLIVYAESRIRYSQPKELIFGVGGLCLGLLTAFMLYQIFFPVDGTESPENIRLVRFATKIILNVLFGYLGIVLALRYAKQIDLSSSRLLSPVDPTFRGAKILDSSVIIDGRFADVLETRFIEGPIIIPHFVLRELQAIADSANPQKRKRGRRGLDMVKRMQTSSDNLRIVDDDFPNVTGGVDSKLVELAKRYNAAVITNDYNLNKVAQIQDVEVLNINDLAGSLRPVVLPDEEMNVFIVKEGKENYQGIGYLEDGTMVVVENGLDYMNEAVDVVVTRVLQTTAGRMIFAKIRGTSYTERED